MDLKYLAVSTAERHEVAEYPDSGKVGCFIGEHESWDLRLLFRAGEAVDYFDGES